jgi:large subunit ribosomal protein L6
MSRIGRKPISLPKGVDVSVKEGRIFVKSSNGELSTHMMPGVNLKIEGGIVNVSRENDEKQTRASHGLIRALVANMVVGVSEGFNKTLELVGVGYRAQLQGKKLVLSLGYSHPIEYEAPDGIEIIVESPTKIVVKGIDKQVVGQVSAILRGYRPPEPYHGKGIRYKGETVVRKAGKAGAK